MYVQRIYILGCAPMTPRLGVVVLALLGSLSNLPAQTTAPPTPLPSAPPPCASAEHRQFDFWIGEWEVRQPGGQAAGTNRITSIHRGCALREEWSGRSGFTGSSLNGYDASTGRWRQTWIGSDGLVLLLEGGMTNGSMEMLGSTVGANGVKTLNRIRWTPLDGTTRVRQLWETSVDGGKTWSVTFDGQYRRKP